MRLRFLLLVLPCSALFANSSNAAVDQNTLCSAYYGVLMVAGDQPDISREISSEAYLTFFKLAGGDSEAEGQVSVLMTQIVKDIPKGKMTPQNIAPLRARYDSPCKAILENELSKELSKMKKPHERQDIVPPLR